MALFSTDGPSFVHALTKEARNGAQLYFPRSVDGRRTWRKTPAEDLVPEEFDLGPARATEPLKSLFFPPRGEVSRFFGDDAREEVPECIVVGARQCDLAALRILDHIFLEGSFTDPFYQIRREKTLVISADCTEPYENCFSSFVEGKPYAESGFDLNLSATREGLVAETGSEKGQGFVERNGLTFRDATPAQGSARDEARKNVADELAARLETQMLNFPDKLRHITRGREDNPCWQARAEDCVECGACNFVCPTCHCFHLLDVEHQGSVRRFADWDSCLYPSFARVAGGANPRKRRAARLLNRFEKKFSFFVDEMDSLACTGCGRCIEACAGGIDIRDILKELAR